MSLKRLKTAHPVAGAIVHVQICFASHDEIRAAMTSRLHTGSIIAPYGEPVFVIDENEQILYTRTSSSYTMVDGKNKIWSTVENIHHVCMAKILTQWGVAWVDPSVLHDFS